VEIDAFVAHAKELALNGFCVRRSYMIAVGGTIEPSMMQAVVTRGHTKITRIWRRVKDDVIDVMKGFTTENLGRSVQINKARAKGLCPAESYANFRALEWMKAHGSDLSRVFHLTPELVSGGLGFTLLANLDFSERYALVTRTTPGSEIPGELNGWAVTTHCGELSRDVFKAWLLPIACVPRLKQALVFSPFLMCEVLTPGLWNEARDAGNMMFLSSSAVARSLVFFQFEEYGKEDPEGFSLFGRMMRVADLAATGRGFARETVGSLESAVDEYLMAHDGVSPVRGALKRGLAHGRDRCLGDKRMKTS